MWAYGAPAGLVSADVASYVRSFVTNMVVGDDMVARLSVSSMEALRDSIVMALVQCKVPKWKLLLGSLTWRNWSYTDLFVQPSSEIDQAVETILRVYHQNVQAGNSSGDALDASRGFWPPGEIAHLRPVAIDERTGDIEHEV